MVHCYYELTWLCTDQPLWGIVSGIGLGFLLVNLSVRLYDCGRTWLYTGQPLWCFVTMNWHGFALVNLYGTLSLRVDMALHWSPSVGHCQWDWTWLSVGQPVCKAL